MGNDLPDAGGLIQHNIELLQRDVSRQNDEQKAALVTLRDELEAHIVKQDEDEREAIRADQETCDAFKRIGEALNDIGGKVTVFETRFDKKLDAFRADIDTKIDRIYSAIKEGEQRSEARVAACRRQQDEEVRRASEDRIEVAVAIAVKETLQQTEEKTARAVTAQKKVCDDLSAEKSRRLEDRFVGIEKIVGEVQKSVADLRNELFKLTVKIAVVSAGVGFGSGLLFMVAKTLVEKYFTKGAS